MKNIFYNKVAEDITAATCDNIFLWYKAYNQKTTAGIDAYYHVPSVAAGIHVPSVVAQHVQTISAPEAVQAWASFLQVRAGTDLCDTDAKCVGVIDFLEVFNQLDREEGNKCRNITERRETDSVGFVFVSKRGDFFEHSLELRQLLEMPSHRNYFATNSSTYRCIDDLALHYDSPFSDVIKRVLSKPPFDSVNATKKNEKSNAAKSAATSVKSNEKQGVKKMSRTIENVKKSLVHGAKVAAADEAGEVVLSIATELFKEVPQVAGPLETETGKSVGKLVLATTLLQLIESKVIPDESGNVEAALVMVVEAAGRDFIQPQLKKLTPQLQRLASVAASAVGNEKCK